MGQCGGDRVGTYEDWAEVAGQRFFKLHDPRISLPAACPPLVSTTKMSTYVWGTDKLILDSRLGHAPVVPATIIRHQLVPDDVRGAARRAGCIIVSELVFVMERDSNWNALTDPDKTGCRGQAVHPASVGCTPAVHDQLGVALCQVTDIRECWWQAERMSCLYCAACTVHYSAKLRLFLQGVLQQLGTSHTVLSDVIRGMCWLPQPAGAKEQQRELPSAATVVRVRSADHVSASNSATGSNLGLCTPLTLPSL